MRVLTPQIAFHGRDGGKNDPILSVDSHPIEPISATAGGDNNVKLWLVSPLSSDASEQPSIVQKGDQTDKQTVASTADTASKPQPDVLTFRTSLTGHSKSVNVVRFSPDGTFLASAGDDGVISIWRLALDKQVSNWSQVETDAQLTRTSLRGHGCDIYDIAWAPQGNAIISGAIDSSVILWNFDRSTARGKPASRYQTHSHYVQGVSWDPFQQYFVTQSCDRTSKIYSQGKPKTKRKDRVAVTKFSHVSTLDRRALGTEPGTSACGDQDSQPANSTEGALPQPETSGENGNNEGSKLRKYERLFLDDSVPTFFRRPSFSPDGSVLILPTGQHTLESGVSISSAHTKAAVPVTLVYARDNWSSPALHLSNNLKASIGVRFSPKRYQLAPGKTDPWLALPYRMIFAVLSLNGVAIYDTQHDFPLAVAENIHFAQMTDLAWSPDGRTMIVCSQDGYASVLLFSEQEIGIPVSSSESVIPMEIRFTKALHETSKASAGKTEGDAQLKSKKKSIATKSSTTTLNGTPQQHVPRRVNLVPVKSKKSESQQQLEKSPTTAQLEKSPTTAQDENSPTTAQVEKSAITAQVEKSATAHRAVLSNQSEHHSDSLEANIECTEKRSEVNLLKPKRTTAGTQPQHPALPTVPVGTATPQVDTSESNTTIHCCGASKSVNTLKPRRVELQPVNSKPNILPVRRNTGTTKSKREETDLDKQAQQTATLTPEKRRRVQPTLLTPLSKAQLVQTTSEPQKSKP